MKLKLKEQCLFKRFRNFIVKTRAEKTGRNISKYNNKNSCTHSCIQTCKVFVEGVKINNEAK
jgi:nucleoid DNA-binding protein